MGPPEDLPQIRYEQEAMHTLEVESDLSQDARDMIRMGKVQETRVSPPRRMLKCVVASTKFTKLNCL